MPDHRQQNLAILNRPYLGDLLELSEEILHHLFVCGHKVFPAAGEVALDYFVHLLLRNDFGQGNTMFV